MTEPVPPKRRQQPERALQRQIAEFLYVGLAGNAVFFHSPNEGRRTNGGALKAMGMLAGLPDLGIVEGGRILWLEVKVKGGRVSDTQAACHASLRRARSPVYIVRSLDDVIAALKGAGVPLRATV